MARYFCQEHTKKILTQFSEFLFIYASVPLLLADQITFVKEEYALKSKTDRIKKVLVTFFFF